MYFLDNKYYSFKHHVTSLCTVMAVQTAKRHCVAKRQRVTRVFRDCCHKLVMNVSQVCEAEKKSNQNTFGLPRARDRAAHYLGISKASLFRLLNKNESEMPTGGQKKMRSKGMKMDDEDAAVIRPALVALVLEKKPIHLDSLLMRIKQDNPGWGWSRSTLHRALTKRCGITFRRREDKHYLQMYEDPGNVQRRAWYLKFFFEYAQQGRAFIFMDESWLNKNMVPSHCWTDGTCDCELKVPSGKGEHWILIGAGSKDGWVDASVKMWKGHVQSEDYHSEMNGEVFQHWLHEHLLPYISPNSCIVINRAPYHTMLTEDTKAATASMKRAQLIDWLVAHFAKDHNGILMTKDRFLTEEMIVIGPSGRPRKNKGWTKQTLYALAKELTPKPRYLVQDWIDAANGTDIRLLILPVAHPMLNPIELMWGQIKRYVRENNREFTMSHIKQPAEDKIRQQDAASWGASYRHTWKYATQQWQADEMLLEDSEDTSEDEDEDDAGHDTGSSSDGEATNSHNSDEEDT